MSSQRLKFTDPNGKHFSQEQVQDVFDFVAAAMDLDAHPKGRKGMFFRTGATGAESVVTAGRQFDDALAKLLGHFGVKLRPAAKGGAS